MSKISVIIPTHNRVAILKQALCHLNNNSVLPDEVIVVDDASSPSVRSVVETEQYQFPINIITLDKPKGASAARNRGILEVQHDLILLIDDDIWPDHHLIYYHKFFHKKHSAPSYGVLGRVIFDPEMPRTPLLHFLEEYGAYRWLAKLQEGQLYSTGILTANISLKRSFLDDDNLFDETFPFNRNEDTEFGLRLMEQGFEPRFHSAPSARHHAPMTLESYTRILSQSGYSKAYWALRKPDDTNFCLMLENLLRTSMREAIFQRVYDEFMANLDDQFLQSDISDCSPVQLKEFCSFMQVAQIWLQDLGKISAWMEIVPAFESMAKDIKQGLECQDKAEMLDHFRRGFQQNPEFFPGAILLAEHLEAQEEFDEAIEILQPFSNSLWAKLRLGKLYYRLGQYDNSLRLSLEVYHQTGHGKAVEQKQRDIARGLLLRLLDHTNDERAWVSEMWQEISVDDPDQNNEWVNALESFLITSYSGNGTLKSFQERFPKISDLHRSRKQLEVLNRTFTSLDFPQTIDEQYEYLIKYPELTYQPLSLPRRAARFAKRLVRKLILKNT